MSSDSRIARLPDILVNQIAAGEVVERPASVVKELVENSLDAGATRIDVLLSGGGIESIQIIDDGSGMIPEDLALCLERHTTSKLRSVSDLESIATFGFRGEALASIASVAELEIVSRTRDASAAHRLAVHYGITTEALRPTGSPVGTSITVSRLFERLPARQKYLRSAGTELSHCGRLMKEMAMAAPETRFYLRHQGRLLAEYVAPGREARFDEAFRVSWKPIVIEESAEGLSLALYLSPPELAQDRGELFLFINGRAVRNRSLLAAVRNAYLQTLGLHHEPSGAVYLDLRPEWVDVNVHPQKMEVRCLKQETIYPWILNAVRKTLSRRAPAPQQEAPLAAPFPSATAEPSALLPDVQSKLRYLGRFQSDYVVCEAEGDLVVIDARTLHEKARRLSLGRALAQRTLRAVPLPLPRVLRVRVNSMAEIDRMIPRFAEAGLELEPFGEGDIAVKTIPDAIPESAIESIVLDTIALARRPGIDPLETLLDVIAARTANDEREFPEHETRRLIAILGDGLIPDESFRLTSSALEKHFRRSERDLT